MSIQFEEILDQCIQQIQAGKSIEDCLAGCPSEMVAELRPLLVSASQVICRPLPEPSPAVFRQGREKMLTRLAEKQSRAPVSMGLLARYAQQIRTFFREKEYQDMRFLTRFAIAGLMVAIVGGLFVTVSASASSLPGDSLYPIKRNLEEVRLLLESNEAAKEQIQQEMQAARSQEIDALQHKGRVAVMDFQGILQAIASDTWTVNGLTLKLDQNTELAGDCVIGALVRVTVQVQTDGTLLLLKAAAIPKKQVTPMPTRTGTQMPRPTEDPNRPTPNSATRTALPPRPTEDPNRPTPNSATQTAMPPRPTQDPGRPTPNSATQTAMPPRPTQDPDHPTPNSATQTALPPRPTEPQRPTLTPGPFYPTPPGGGTHIPPATKPATPNNATRTPQPTKPPATWRTPSPTRPAQWPTPTLPAYPGPGTPQGPRPTRVSPSTPTAVVSVPTTTPVTHQPTTAPYPAPAQ